MAASPLEIFSASFLLSYGATFISTSAIVGFGGTLRREYGKAVVHAGSRKDAGRSIPA